MNAGCQRFDRIAALLRDHDLEFHFIGDDVGKVERASVSVDTRVIATARQSQTRVTANPAVTEVEVEETHFVRGTLTVTYTGRVTFACTAGQAFCTPLRVTPASGTRARNVFWRWPASMRTSIPSEFGIRQ
jgi:hypothetical protein